MRCTIGSARDEHRHDDPGLQDDQVAQPGLKGVDLGLVVGRPREPGCDPRAEGVARVVEEAHEAQGRLEQAGGRGAADRADDQHVHLAEQRERALDDHHRERVARDGPCPDPRAGIAAL